MSQVFLVDPRGVTPQKSPAKILPFFLIGVILLRNYHLEVKKNGFKVGKTSKKMAKESDLVNFRWQNADS